MVMVLPESKLIESSVEAVIPVIHTMHSTDTNQPDVNCVEDLRISQEQSPSGKEVFVTEDEDPSEMHDIPVAQESGSLSLPSEWQGASVVSVWFIAGSMAECGQDTRLGI